MLLVLLGSLVLDLRRLVHVLTVLLEPGSLVLVVLGMVAVVLLTGVLVLSDSP